MTDIHFWSYLAQFFSEWEMFQTKVVEKIKNTHFVFCNFFFFQKVVPFMIRRGKILQSGAAHRWQYGVERISCWVTKATTHTLTICNTFCFSTAKIGCKNSPRCCVICTSPAFFCLCRHFWHQKQIKTFLNVGSKERFISFYEFSPYKQFSREGIKLANVDITV